MPADLSGLRFSRRQRIQLSRDFRRLRNEGRRLVSGGLLLSWLELPPGSSTRLGVITSRRIGNAVARNRARRLLREAFRLHQHQLVCPVDMVLVARHEIVEKGFSEVERNYLRGLERARLLKPNESSVKSSVP